MEQGGWNLFAFVNNNSISFSDKIGLFTLIVEVFRYEQREEAIYSNITVSSDDPMVNKCCCLPQFYCGVERGVKYTENLLDTIKRVLEYWDSDIKPELKKGKKIIIAAHGNSLRGLIKYLDNMSDEDVIKLELQTGNPICYELDDNLKPIRHYYLKK